MKKHEQLNLVFSGIGSISALIVTLLALWGVFFTTLPEKILSEFRTDIKETKEELIELRQEKINVVEQNKKILEERNKLSSTNSILINSLNDLKSEYLSLQAEVRNYKESETLRLSNNYRDIATSYIQELRNKIADGKDDALFLANFNEIRNWLNTKPIHTYASENNYEKTRKEYWVKYKEWQNSYDFSNRFPWLSMEETIDSHRKYIKSNYVKDNNITLLQAIKVSLTKTKFNHNNKSAFEKLKLRIDKFTTKNSKQLGVFIEPVIYTSYNDNEFIKAGKNTLKTIGLSEKIIADLELMLLK